MDPQQRLLHQLKEKLSSQQLDQTNLDLQNKQAFHGETGGSSFNPNMKRSIEKDKSNSGEDSPNQ